MSFYSEDKNWYRVKLMDCQNETFEVHFIDFGNRCWTNQITELPTILEIFEIQNYAEHCELKNH